MTIRQVDTAGTCDVNKVSITVQVQPQHQVGSLVLRLYHTMCAVCSAFLAILSL